MIDGNPVPPYRQDPDSYRDLPAWICKVDRMWRWFLKCIGRPLKNLLVKYVFLPIGVIGVILLIFVFLVFTPEKKFTRLVGGSSTPFE